jgi:hypothetical protein
VHVFHLFHPLCFNTILHHSINVSLLLMIELATDRVVQESKRTETEGVDCTMLNLGIRMICSESLCAVVSMHNEVGTGND